MLKNKLRTLKLRVFKPKKDKKPEGIGSIIVAVLVALALRTFVAEPFAIPSGSMIPSLLVGDYLFVTKYNYGYCRYSFLFGWPPFKGRVFPHQPKRGEVVVFMGGEGNETRYIKRLIGLPGDTVDIKKGVVYINGEPAPQKRIEDYVERTASGRTKSMAQYLETLPGGVEHLMIREDPQGDRPEDNKGPFHVPEGHYFMMGDNRNHSGDSRYDSMGYIPFNNLVGPAKLIFFSVDSSIWDLLRVWDWPETFRYKRVFHWIN